MSGAVEWSHGPENSRSLRVLTHLLAGAVAVCVGAGVVAFGSFVWRQATGGDPRLAAAAVALALVGGWASVAYLVPMLADGGLRRELLSDPAVQVLRPAGVALAAVVLASTVAGAVVAGAPVATALVVAFVGPLFLWGLLRTGGWVDPATDTVRTRHREVTADGMTAVRSLAAGPVVVFWCSYARGRGGLDVPRLLVVPDGTAPAVRRALEAIADPDADADSGDLGERLAVGAAAGACFLAAGAVLVGPSIVDIPSALWVFALPSTVVGVVFLVGAWLE